MITQKKIIAAANEINWQCDIQKNDKFDFNKKYYKKWSISFSCYTRFGQDVNVNFQINTLDNLSLEIYDYWQITTRIKKQYFGLISQDMVKTVRLID